MLDSQDNDPFAGSDGVPAGDNDLRALVQTRSSQPLPCLDSADFTIMNGATTSSQEHRLLLEDQQRNASLHLVNSYEQRWMSPTNSRQFYQEDNGVIGNYDFTHEQYEYLIEAYDGDATTAMVEEVVNRSYGRPEPYGVPVPHAAIAPEFRQPDELQGLQATPPPTESNQGVNFAVSVADCHKRSSANFVATEDVVYTKAATMVPFVLEVTNDRGEAVSAAGCRVSCRLRFAQPEHSMSRVEACPIHRLKKANSAQAGFIHRIECSDVAYDETNLSIVVVWPENKILPIAFDCLSSCNGGIERRPVFMEFDLLPPYGTEVMATAQHGVKICANPQRDAVPKRAHDRTSISPRKRSADETETQNEVKKRKGRLSIPGDIREGTIKNEYAMHQSLVPTSAPPPLPRRTSRVAALRSGRTVITATSSKEDEATQEDDTVYDIQVRGTHKYKLVMAVLAELEKSERYSAMMQQMRSGGDVKVNPLREVSSLGPVTSIREFLKLKDISLPQYIEHMEREDIFTMADLLQKYNADRFFEKLGVPKADAKVLDRVYLNWANVHKLQNIKKMSLEDAGGGSQSQSQGSGRSVVRVSRTTFHGSIHH